MDESQKLSQLGSVLCALWYGVGRWGGGDNTGGGCGVVVCCGKVWGDGVVVVRRWQACQWCRRWWYGP